MYDVLVYLRDDQFEEEIIDTFREAGYIYHRASGVDDAMTIAGQESIDILLVWQPERETLQQIFSRMNRQKLGHLPVFVVMNARQDPGRFLDMPISDLIPIPIPREEFIDILGDFLRRLEGGPAMNPDSPWDGNLSDFKLVDLLQLLAVNRKDAIMSITCKGHIGQLYFKNGNLIKITFRNLEGLSALFKLASLRKGDFQIRFTAIDLPDNLKISNDLLLSQINDYLSELDEYFRLLPDSDEELLTFNYPEPSEMDELTEKILQMCQEGLSLHDLFLTLNEDNRRIAKTVLGLLQDGYLVQKRDYKTLHAGRGRKKGLGRIFGSLTGLLKKKTEEPPPPEFSPVSETATPEEPRPEVEPRIVYKPPEIDHKVVDKIQKFLG